MSNLPRVITRGVWYALFGAHVAIVLWYWWQGSAGLLSAGVPSVLIAVGRLAGLSAAAAVLLQFVFMGRTPWLERTFGLDHLSRIHHTTGKYSIFLLLAHPVLLTVGYSQVAGVNLWDQFLSFLFDYEHVSWAAVGLLLFSVVVVTSLVIVRQRLRYESWYFVHLLVYLAVFASFWHQISVGSDLLASRVFYGYWLALYAVVFGSHLVFRFIAPVYRSLHHRFTVSRIERETHNAVSIYITGQDLAHFRIYPGQFMILRFLTKGRWWQAHPFSLSRLPDGQGLRVTVKELGDFTRGLQTLPLGTRVLIDGPYGVFTEWFSVSPKVLFIAGGIGITPIRALLERMLQRGKDVRLLYANRTQRDIVFKDELAQLTRQHPAVITHVLSDEPSYSGEVGHIDTEKLQRLVPDLATREVFLCGPVAMMDALVQILRQLGVPRERIHFERFSL